jgi:hypothetical protein
MVSGQSVGVAEGEGDRVVIRRNGFNNLLKCLYDQMHMRKRLKIVAIMAIVAIVATQTYYMLSIF